MALFQSGFSGLALTAFIQYQSSTRPEIINADAILINGLKCVTIAWLTGGNVRFFMKFGN